MNNFILTHMESLHLTIIHKWLWHIWELLFSKLIPDQECSHSHLVISWSFVCVGCFWELRAASWNWIEEVGRYNMSMTVNLSMSWCPIKVRTCLSLSLSLSVSLKHVFKRKYKIKDIKTISALKRIDCNR